MKTRITRRYLAGLIDGEGYISMRPTVSEHRVWFKPVIKMALTEKTAYILFEIKDLLGGHIHKREYTNEKYNIAYYWEVQTFVAVEKVINFIRPYLILKKEQADLVHELILTKGHGGKYIKISQEVIDKRQRLYTRLRELNKRGRTPAETKCEPPEKQDEVIVRTSGQPEEVNRNIGSAELICA